MSHNVVADRNDSEICVKDEAAHDICDGWMMSQSDARIAESGLTPSEPGLVQPGLLSLPPPPLAPPVVGDPPGILALLDDE